MHVKSSSWSGTFIPKTITAGLALSNSFDASLPPLRNTNQILGRRGGSESDLLPLATPHTKHPNKTFEMHAFSDEAPDWRWMNIAGARCGDGSGTGMAISEGMNKKRAILVFDDGGACSDFLTCHVLRTVSHLDGYTAATFTRDDAFELNERFVLTTRTQLNPFYRDNMAFFPYCTGDIFIGQNVVWYPPSLRSTHHVGYANVGLYLDAVATKWPHLEQVILAGASAGGFGAALNFDQAKARWPRARIDVLDDSGLAFEGVRPASSWKARFPDGWSTDDTFASHFLHQVRRHPDSTFGITMFLYDPVLAFFEGVDPLSLNTHVDALATASKSYSNFAFKICPSALWGHSMLKSLDRCYYTDLPDWLAENFNGGWPSFPESTAENRALASYAGKN